MKTLYLLRHANAASRQLNFTDYDRPLDEIGDAQANAVAEYIKEKNIIFDYIMCSGALRAQETLEPLRTVLNIEDIETSETFYNISDEQILNALRKVSDLKEKVLFIGHNPGLTFTIIKLAKVFPQVINEGFTPASLIGFQLPVDSWADLDWWQGQVIDVFQPSLPSEEAPLPEES